jgi:cell division protein FtsZ
MSESSRSSRSAKYNRPDEMEIINKDTSHIKPGLKPGYNHEEVDMERISLFRKPVSPIDEESYNDEKESEDYQPEKEEERTFVFDVNEDDLKDDLQDAAPPETGSKTPENQPVAETPAEEPPVKPFEVYIKKSAEESKPAGNNNERKVLEQKTRERIEKLKSLSYKLKSESGLEKFEKQPAYVRRNVEINQATPSKESKVSKYSLYENEEKNVEIKSNNSYLHDNVD